MAEDHDRYEELAVGHVLGGLSPGRASQFRHHLGTCRDCRVRVAELRGIAADLEAAERDELTRAAVRTEVLRSLPADDLAARRTSARLRIAGLLLLLVAAGALAFWNLHLRTAAATYESVARAQHETLRTLAGGVALPAQLGDGVDGLVAADDRHVAFSLSGVEQVVPGERIVVWLVGAPGSGPGELAPGGAGGVAAGDGARIALVVLPGQVVDGALAAVVEIRDAHELWVTREQGTLGSEPGGRPLAIARLRAPAG